MTLTVNGKPVIVTEGITIAEWLAGQGLNAAAAVIELNQAIVKKDAWAGTILSDGDCLEVVTFVGGG